MGKKSKKVKESEEIEELSGQQVMVLFMLLSGKTQREAAAACDLNEATVSRWMHGDPAFIAAYNDAIQSLYDSGLADLLEARRKAIGVLSDMLDRGEWRKRLRAAELVLKFTTRPEGATNKADVDIQLRSKEKNRENARMFQEMGI